MLVTSSRAPRPGAAPRRASAAVVPESLVQPSTATSPSRTSIATTSASPKRAAAAARKAGERAAVPDHDPVRARGERRGDRIERAVATADLEWQAAGRRDPLDELERRRAAERAVEVDEVEAARTFVAEAPRELDGIAALDRDRLAPPLRKPHDPSLEDVDRGRHLELSVVLARYHAIMYARHDGPHDRSTRRLRTLSTRSSPIDRGHRRARRRDPNAPDDRRGDPLPPRPLHARRARGARAPLEDGSARSTRACRTSRSPSGCRPRRPP